MDAVREWNISQSETRRICSMRRSLWLLFEDDIVLENCILGEVQSHYLSLLNSSAL